jgi:hypothetical protein
MVKLRYRVVQEIKTGGLSYQKNTIIILAVLSL